MNDVKCGVCSCVYGVHYNSFDGEWSGCSECEDCEGFADPEDMLAWENE